VVIKTYTGSIVSNQSSK